MQPNNLEKTMTPIFHGQIKKCIVQNSSTKYT